MKKTLLSIFAASIAASVASAQMYSPSASALPAGTIGQAYAGQVINFTVPTTSSVDGATVGNAVASAFPQAALVTSLLAGQTFPLTVSSTTLSVSGLPAGVTATCDATPCTYIAGASGSITLSGTPTQPGTFTIDIASVTSGEADLSAFAGALSGFGIPSSFAIPQPIPGALDEEGYTMNVSDPNGIKESNSVFSLGLYPNPTEGVSTLDVNSTVAGTATIEVYSITGALIQTSSKSIRIGANRLSLDFSSVPAGIYLVKADINGHQALIRTQKK
ncbi:MAG: T9SS type A sorting domain-containing protein [Flavobacteriales bacterium]|nr:T9SS type A sorting domain-containing protein [Flavobacteriales bacterium]